MDYQQLASLLIDLKISNFIAADNQLDLIGQAARLLECSKVNNPGNAQLLAALEQIQDCHRIPFDIRSEARRITESWVPF